MDLAHLPAGMATEVVEEVQAQEVLIQAAKDNV